MVKAYWLSRTLAPRPLLVKFHFRRPHFLLVMKQLGHRCAPVEEFRRTSGHLVAPNDISRLRSRLSNTKQTGKGMKCTPWPSLKPTTTSIQTSRPVYEGVKRNYCKMSIIIVIIIMNSHLNCASLYTEAESRWKYSRFKAEVNISLRKPGKHEMAVIDMTHLNHPKYYQIPNDTVGNQSPQILEF